MSRGTIACALAALAAFVACADDDARAPEAGRATFDLVFAGAAEDRDLRIAVVWTTLASTATTVGFFVSEDQVVTSAHMTIALTPPEAGLAELTAPQERLQITAPLTGAAATAYRPRFVIYDDVDRNHRLNTDAFGAGGPDRILGADASSPPIVAYVFDLDLVLSRLDVSGAGVYYRATGDRYTAFADVGGSFDQLEIPSDDDNRIIVDGSPVHGASVACLRRLFSGNTPPTATDFVVDPSLDATAVCGTNARACLSRDLEGVEPPELTVTVESEEREEEEILRPGVSCRRNEIVELLLVFESTLVCEDCVCVRRTAGTAFAVVPGTGPSWWPCGDSVPYCDSELPIAEPDPKCSG